MEIHLQKKKRGCPLFYLPVFILVLFASGICACQKETVFVEENFVNLYIELHLATLGNSHNQERASKIRKVILEKYKMKTSDFSEKLKTLKANPEIWKDFQEKVIENLGKMEKEHKGE